jgi:AraC-like DNA-binding protein
MERIVACYREFVPHPALQGKVRALFSFTAHVEPSPSRRITFEKRCAPGDPYSSPSFADGASSIVFDLGMIFHPDGTWEGSAAVLGKVIGPMRRVARAARDFRRELPAMVGAYLHPARLSAFARLPSCEVTDRILPIEELWGSAATHVSEDLATLNESARLDLLESALLGHMAEPRERGGAVEVRGLAACVVRRGGRVAIDDLATAAGVSRQHLTRVFRERVGVSPKVYCRLARFQAALAYVRPGHRVDWARVACALGYADQSHMIAEFRQFSGLTPHMLATGRWYHPFIERASARAEPRLIAAPRAGVYSARRTHSAVAGSPGPL